MDGNSFSPAGKGRSKVKPAAAETVAVAAKMEAPDDGALRIEEIRRRRSERGHIQDGPSMKLSVPEGLKDPRFQYRWANDKATRVHDLKSKDWDFVPDGATGNDPRDMNIGTRPERIVNERTTPSPEKAFLMRKPKEFYALDKSREQQHLAELEDGIQRGQTRDPEGLSGPHAYIPSGGMSIKHGR